MNAHLIQRARFEDRDYKKGIDSVVRFDHMGSSEFEYGALPESLGKIRSAITEYLDVPVKDKVITVFCKNSQKAEVKTYLNDLAEDKFSLQEWSDFETKGIFQTELTSGGAITLCFGKRTLSLRRNLS